MVVVEDRQTQLPAQGQHARGEAKQQGGDDHHVVAADIVLQGDIQNGGGKRDPGEQLFLEHQRDALTEHIPQHAAEYAGDDRRDRGDNRAFSHIEGNLRADD